VSELFDPTKYTGPPDEALLKAREEIQQRFLGEGLTHKVGIGEIRKDGQATGEIGVVVSVEEKFSPQGLREHGLNPIPEKVIVTCSPDGGFSPQKACEVKVDVQQVPRMRDQRLRLGNPHDMLRAAAYASPLTTASDLQGCFMGPLPGGVQIAPERAGWVGTLGGFCTFADDQGGGRVIGAFTNYHVAVSEKRRGVLIGQPSGNSPHEWFGKLVRWSPMHRDRANRVDGAVIDTFRDDGKYAPGRHNVKPSQYKIGAIKPDPVLQYRVGDVVQKVGRTTGHTRGRVVEVMAVSQVDYGADGLLTFDGQNTIRGDSSEFSGPGDSGSLVLTPDNRPYGLLFAGGGGTTLINQMKDVIELFEMKFAA
jgi:hypothetical protein